MGKRLKRIMILPATLAVILGGSTAAFAIDLNFLRGLTGHISQLTQINQDVLNSGIDNLAAVRQIFRTGDVGGGLADLARVNVGSLGVPDVSAGRTRELSSEAINSLDLGSGTTLADNQHRSLLTQRLIHQVLGQRGQRQSGELLARSGGYSQVARQTLETQEQLNQEAIAEADKTSAAARDITAKGQQAQGYRSSHDVLKAIASQNVDLGQQQQAIGQQYTTLSAGLSNLGTQLGAQSSQLDLVNRQLVGDQVTQTFQLQSLDGIGQQLAVLNNSAASEHTRNAGAVTGASQEVIIPQLHQVGQ